VLLPLIRRKKLNNSLKGLNEAQLIKVVKEACSHNSKLLDAVQHAIADVEMTEEETEKSAPVKKTKKPAAKPEPKKGKAKVAAPAKKGKGKAKPKKAVPPSTRKSGRISK